MPVNTDTNGKLIGVVDLNQRPEIINDGGRFFVGLFPDELPWIGPFKTSTDAVRWLRQMFGDAQMEKWTEPTPIDLDDYDGMPQSCDWCCEPATHVTAIDRLPICAECIDLNKKEGA